LTVLNIMVVYSILIFFFANVFLFIKEKGCLRYLYD